MFKNLKYIFALLLIAFNTSFANSSSNFEEEVVGGRPVYVSKTENKDWQVNLAIASAYGSAFAGSKKNTFGFLPFPLIQYKNFLQFSLGEMKVNAISLDGFTAGATLGWDAGRKKSRDKKMLDGINDISVSGLAGIFTSYQYGGLLAYADVKYNFGAGVNSPISKLALSYSQMLSSSWILTGTISTNLAGKNYINKWFGVTEEESTKTGLAKYEVSNSISIVKSAVEVSVSHIVANNMIVTVGGEYYMLGSKTKNSSLIKERGKNSGFSTIVALIYTF